MSTINIYIEVHRVPLPLNVLIDKECSEEASKISAKTRSTFAFVTELELAFE
jgi:hypothetical protein